MTPLYQFLFILLLAACSTTSKGLLEDATASCKDTPELDNMRNYCIGFRIQEECQAENLDLRLCGKVER